MNADMPLIVAQIGLFPSAIFVVLVATVLIFWLLNQSPAAEWFKGAEDIVPPYLSVVALLFGLFAATLAADIWPKQDEAKKMLINETSAIRSLFATSEHLKSADKDKLSLSVKRYVEAVLEKEWPAMVAGDHENREGALPELQALSRTAIQIARFEKLPRILENRLQQSIDEIRIARLSRLSLAHDSISFIKWRAVILFGVLLLFTVGLVHLRRPRAMKIALFVTTLGVLLTIGILANNRSPYSGKDAIEPDMLADSLVVYVTNTNAAQQ